MKHLVFVVGFPRSGTTFLATKLGALEGCVATPETRYFAEAVAERAGLSTRVKRGQLKAELSTMRRIQDLGLDLDQVLPGPDTQTLDRRDGFTALMTAYGAAHQADTVIEKSPVHTYYLPQILKAYPEAKVIAILRDGRDALLSLRNTPWGDWPAERYAADWVYRQALVEKATQIAPNRVTTVRFEDLVQDQDATLSALADWLGLTGETQENTGKIGTTIPEWEKGWKEKAASSADSSRVAVWQQETATEYADELRQFTALAGDTLQELGYEAPASTQPGRRKARIYPIKRAIKQAVRKVFILAGQADRISSEQGLKRRLDAKSD